MRRVCVGALTLGVMLAGSGAAAAAQFSTTVKLIGLRNDYPITIGSGDGAISCPGRCTASSSSGPVGMFLSVNGNWDRNYYPRVDGNPSPVYDISTTGCQVNLKEATTGGCVVTGKGSKHVVEYRLRYRPLISMGASGNASGTLQAPPAYDRMIGRQLGGEQIQVSCDPSPAAGGRIDPCIQHVSVGIPVTINTQTANGSFAFGYNGGYYIKTWGGGVCASGTTPGPNSDVTAECTFTPTEGMDGSCIHVTFGDPFKDFKPSGFENVPDYEMQPHGCGVTGISAFTSSFTEPFKVGELADFTATQFGRAVRRGIAPYWYAVFGPAPGNEAVWPYAAPSAGAVTVEVIAQLNGRAGDARVARSTVLAVGTKRWIGPAILTVLSMRWTRAGLALARAHRRPRGSVVVKVTFSPAGGAPYSATARG